MAMIAISAIGIVFPVLSVFIAPHLDSFSENSYANELFLLLSAFSTVYIFLLIFCLPVKVVFKEILRMLKIDIKEDIGQRTSSNNSEHNNNRLKTQTKIGFLLLAMFLSVILVLIPQHPSINKDNQDIGVDTHYYVTWIGELANRKVYLTLLTSHLLYLQGQDGDRPLSLIFMFLVYQVVGGIFLK